MKINPINIYCDSETTNKEREREIAWRERKREKNNVEYE